MLLDAYGKPLKRPAARDLDEELAAPTIGSVRQVLGGHPADGLTPKRLGEILKTAEQGDADAYLEMAEQFEEKDLHYAGVLGVRKRAIRAMELTVTPGDDTAQAEDAAALVREALGGTETKDHLIDMLDAVGKSYSVHEIVWNTSGARWTIARLEFRDPRWFRYDERDGRTLLLRDNDGDVPLAPGRFVLHQAKAKSGLPIRGGLARLAAWAYVFKNYSLKDWAVFLEAYGHPVRLGRYGPNASPEDKRTLLRAVRAIGTDMAAIVPKGMDIDIINGNVTGAAASYEAAARYWDEQISKAVLGQVSTTDAIAGGHAVGKVHAEVRDDIRDADAEQLAATLQRDIAAPLTAWNFGPGTAAPKIEFSAPEEFDPAKQMAAIRTFGPMGVKVSVAQVREIWGLREPAEGEELLSFPARTAPERPPQLSQQAASAQASHVGPLDRMIDGLLDGGGTEPAARAMLDGLMEAIDSATSLEEVRDILDSAALDDAEMVELMARSLFVARLAGETGAI